VSKDSKSSAHVQRTSRVAFGMVDAAVIRDETLPPMVKLVYTHLATYCSDVRSAFPSRATIARQIGLSVRSVATAIKQAQDAGLFTIEHRIGDDGRQTSNLYLLHDLGGGYVIGSGPLRGAPDARGPVQDVHGGGAPGAHEQDHANETSQRQTTSTSSDAASGAPSASGCGDTEIFIPRDFAKWTDGRVYQHLVKASISALRAAGLEPAPDAADRIGRAVKATSEDDGVTREDLVRMLEVTLGLAGTSDKTWGSLATRRAA
jgi:hypothetical protein